jgi:hypothetical protein
MGVFTLPDECNGSLKIRPPKNSLDAMGAGMRTSPDK